MLYFVSVFILWIVLGILSPFFSFDFINGGNGLWVSSKNIEESRFRGTYLGELKLIQTIKIDGVELKLKNGWVENIWYGGIWYYTTNIVKGYTIHFDFNMRNLFEKGYVLERDSIYNDLVFGNTEALYSCEIEDFENTDEVEFFIMKKKTNERNSDREKFGVIRFKFIPIAQGK